MDDPTGSWSDDLSGRERVRRVVETLQGPQPIQQIAERADVARGTAADELDRLERDDWVIETTVDGAKAYDLNPVRMLFDEVTDLIAAHSRDELEQRFTELTAEIEDLEAEYDVTSLDEFRDQFAADAVPAAELRERRTVIETWEALETDRDLLKHAIQLYDDIVELSNAGGKSAQSIA